MDLVVPVFMYINPPPLFDLTLPATHSLMSTSADIPPPSSATSNMTSSEAANKVPAGADETLFQQMEVAKTVLKQAVDLLDNQLTSDDQLTVHSQYLPGSTIGMDEAIIKIKLLTHACARQTSSPCQRPLPSLVRVHAERAPVYSVV